MSTLLIIGWLFLLATWIPKPFIEDDQKRKVINLSLNVISLLVFIAGVIIHLIK